MRMFLVRSYNVILGLTSGWNSHGMHAVETNKIAILKYDAYEEFVDETTKRRESVKPY